MNNTKYFYAGCLIVLALCLIIGNVGAAYLPVSAAVATDTYSGYNILQVFKGQSGGSGWCSNYVTNQRINVDLGSAQTVEKITLGSWSGGSPNSIMDFTIWGSNSGTSYSNTAYATDTGWTQLMSGQSTPPYDANWTLTSPGSYRYYSIKAANDHGGGNMCMSPQTSAFYALSVSAPVASFTKDHTYGDVPLTIVFIDTSTNTPTSWYWVFGDGTTSTTQSPSHQYTTAGTYNANLTAKNAGGSSTTATQQIIVNPVSVVSSFTKNVSSGVSPVAVQFTDTSTNLPTSWYWVFGDGGTSTSQNPSHTFTGTGRYYTNLTAQNAAGGSISNTQTIDVAGVPTAVFSSYPSIAFVYPMNTTFTDLSTGVPTSWLWDFGDGHTATSQNATHQFLVAGNYTVSLTATNAYGSNTVSHVITLYSDDDVYLTSWSHFNTSTIIDLKGNYWLLAGGLISSGTSKFGGTSLHVGTVNGSQYPIISLAPTSSTWNFGTGDFSIEFWLYPDVLNGLSQDIVSRTSNGDPAGWGFQNGGTSSNYSFWMGSNSTHTTPFAITTGTWTHIVITRISGTVEVFKNGALMSQNTMAGNYDTTNSLVLGTKALTGGGGSYYFDEWRLTRGFPRFTYPFDSPTQEYRGDLFAQYPNINPDAELRYKTDPGTIVYISNLVDRNRTVQIQNIVNATQIHVVLSYNPAIIRFDGAFANTTDYPNLVISGVVDDQSQGTITFNISRANGIVGAGAQRINIADLAMKYYQYSADQFVTTYFNSGYCTITSAGNSVTYPIVYFSDTPVYLIWTVISGFSANNTAPSTNSAVLFTADQNTTANQFHWDFGDGNSLLTTNGLAQHTYTTPGLKTVVLHDYLAINNSVQNTTTRVAYINVSSNLPQNVGWVANITSNTLALAYNAQRFVSFTPTWTVGTPTAFHWMLDGQRSTNQTLIGEFWGGGTIIWGGPGVHTVNLSLINADGSTPWFNSTYITSGLAPVMINASVGPYTDAQSYPDVGIAFGAGYDGLLGGKPDTFTYDFGDGTIVSRNSLNISFFRQYDVHRYTTAGNYTVRIYGVNAWGTSAPVSILYTILARPALQASTMRWTDINGNTITTALTGDTRYFAFDTVNTGTNPPVGTINTAFYLLKYSLDKNTGLWINDTIIGGYLPFTAQRDDRTYTQNVSYTLAYSGHRWTGVAAVNFPTPTTYRVYLVGFNGTAGTHYTYGYSDIVVGGNAIPLDQTGDWAAGFGGDAFKLILAIVIVMIALGLPLILTGEVNIYIETLAVVLAIGLCYFMELVALWIIFALGIVAVIVVLFMNRGSGNSGSSGGDLG